MSFLIVGALDKVLEFQIFEITFFVFIYLPAACTVPTELNSIQYVQIQVCFLSILCCTQEVCNCKVALYTDGLSVGKVPCSDFSFVASGSYLSLICFFKST